MEPIILSEQIYNLCSTLWNNILPQTQNTLLQTISNEARGALTFSLFMDADVATLERLIITPQDANITYLEEEAGEQITLLNKALQEERVDLIDFLLAHGANFDEGAVFEALHSENFDVFMIALSTEEGVNTIIADRDNENEWLTNSIIHIILNDRMDKLLQLQAYGMTFDVDRMYITTAILKDRENKNIGYTSFLIDNGFPIETTKEACVLMAVSTVNGNNVPDLSLVKYLLQKGADPNISKYGETPADVCVEHPYFSMFECLIYILEYGGKVRKYTERMQRLIEMPEIYYSTRPDLLQRFTNYLAEGGNPF